MTAPSHDEESASAAGADRAPDEPVRVEDDQQRVDRLLAELEALLEEAKQLRTRYRQRPPATRS
jgi:hypothetical protein